MSCRGCERDGGSHGDAVDAEGKQEEEGLDAKLIVWYISQ